MSRHLEELQDLADQEEFQINVEEIARIALEDQDYRNHIGHELDLSDEEMEEVYQKLMYLLNKENQNG